MNGETVEGRTAFHVPGSTILALALGWPAAIWASAAISSPINPRAFATLSVVDFAALSFLWAGLVALAAWPLARYLAASRQAWRAIALVVAVTVLAAAIWNAMLAGMPAGGGDPAPVPAIPVEFNWFRLRKISSIWPLPLAAVPFILLVMLAGATRITPAMDRAVASLGAGRWARFRHVDLSMAWPMALAAWLLGGTIVWTSMLSVFPGVRPELWLFPWDILSLACILAGLAVSRTMVRNRPAG